MSRQNTPLVAALLVLCLMPSLLGRSYPDRRTRLSQAIPEGIFVLLSEPFPTYGRYHQSHDFYYLTGVDEDRSALLLSKQGDQVFETLYLQEVPRSRTQWDHMAAVLIQGEAASDELKRSTGFQRIRPHDSLQGDLLRSLSRQNPPQLSYCATGSDPSGPLDATRDLVRQIRDSLPELVVANVCQSLHELRRIKDDTEIDLIQTAVDITGEAIIEVLRQGRPGLDESELEGIIEGRFRSRQARFEAFPSIIGSGPNSLVLHYSLNRRQIQSGEVVVMDVGAEFDHYAADVTRTIPISGRFTPRQRQILNLVLGAQEAAFQMIKPGVTVAQVHQAARGYLASQSAGDGKTYADYFIHGTSHYIGMDVHDVGSYSKPLEPGVVISVEPGIYLKDEGFGVRVEDDVLITETGFRWLSRDIPRTADEIEKAMAGDAMTSRR